MGDLTTTLIEEKNRQIADYRGLLALANARNDLLQKEIDDLMQLLKYPDLFNEWRESRNPRVLSYDEMKTMIGKPVYVEEPKRNADPHCYWGIVVEGEEPPKEGGYNYPGGVDFNVEVGLNVCDGDLYMVDIGCGWRAWTAEPTDDQRMNTPWEGR